jgi:hypothetical protein
MDDLLHNAQDIMHINNINYRSQGAFVAPMTCIMDNPELAPELLMNKFCQLRNAHEIPIKIISRNPSWSMNLTEEEINAVSYNTEL